MKIKYKVLFVLVEYYARKNRLVHPHGGFDKQKRWYPRECEQAACCEGIRQPTRNWPNSLNTHCRSLKHICTLHGVDEKEVRALSRQIASLFKSDEVIRLMIDWVEQNNRRRVIPIAEIKGIVMENYFQ